jgi:hypothetical protein
LSVVPAPQPVIYRDGDTDIVSASENDDEITWFDNDGSQTFTARFVSTTADGAREVFPGDIDGDADLDMVFVSLGADEIGWLENNGSQIFTPHLLSRTGDGPSPLFVTDLDLDGDVDVLSAFSGPNRITWYEHINPLCTACRDDFAIDEDEVLVVDAAVGLLATDEAQPDRRQAVRGS